MAKMVLEGIRIVDWTHAAAGPAGTMWLAMFGAEVIKVEPLQGDRTRVRQQPLGTGPYGMLPGGIKGINAYMENLNNNKKSIAVDLTREEGREVIYRLVGTSDVFVHNRLADAVKNRAMDYETLQKYNPKLIYAECTVFGPKGPRALVPAADPAGQAISGVLMTSGFNGDPPTWGPPGIGDFGGGYSVFSGIVMALLHRERTGEPQLVHGSQLQFGMNVVNLYATGQFILRSEEEHRQHPNYAELRHHRREELGNPLDYTMYFECKDGKWVSIAAQSDDNWKAFAQSLEPELFGNPKFKTRELRADNRKELFTLMTRIFLTKTLTEWEERFRGANCTFCPIHRIRDLPTEPQVIANDYLLALDHPVAGPIKYPGPPVSLSKSPGSIRAPAPGLGEHTDEILLELGYSPDELMHLHEEKVVV